MVIMIPDDGIFVDTDHKVAKAKIKLQSWKTKINNKSPIKLNIQLSQQREYFEENIIKQSTKINI